MRLSLLLLLFLSSFYFAAAQTPPPRFTTIGRIIRQAPGLDQLLAPDARIEIVAAGLGHTEGPVWVPDSSMLLFTDAPTRTVYRWSATGGLSKFLEHTGYTGRMPYGKEPGSNGLALDGRGNLLICDHGDRRLALLPLGGKSGKRTLTDNFEGKRYNSPNDVVVHPTNRSIYFTDPPYGLPQQTQDVANRELPVCGVYRLAPDGKVSQEIKELALPNGLAFSPDGRTLYVSQSDSLRPLIMAYDVRANGQLGKGRVFFDMSKLDRPRPKETPDGLKTDRNGNVWAAGFGGIVVVSARGQHLGTIDTGEVVSNCAWGDDGRTLYIASGSFLCRVQTLVQGF
ncbi:SMP-30/gluconolactonase/LRE family protein [Hymenobacter sp. YC55]|uniref:SMP-30/gluconolactonase/LRE family protein n=1 Tax=Hymenobacter sp. YC55 TaxID=3034019 RepID=UPI0023F9903B|nr:SMP-30/gluconolactonase/LRE family protein [Hymenobacter sp. YC55]MDF7812080.1 SMP-30/gluconolactonase/LRE family protein [Hymenobacter sp. YC55]